MCSLTISDQDRIKHAIKDLVKKKRRFTGHDVSVLARKLPHVSGGLGVGHSEASSYVRELFNRHDPCFVGYACYPIPGKNSPLLYFYAGAEVMRRGEEISASIEAAAPTAL